MESFLSNRSVLNEDAGALDTFSRGVRPQAGFQSLLSASRKPEPEVIPTPQATVVEATVEPDAEEMEEPVIEVINGEGGIERIIITCTCCKRIELRCQY